MTEAAAPSPSWFGRRLRYIRQNVLGMNLRNSEFIFKHNPAHLFQLVDNKILTKRALMALSLPTPEMYFTVSSYFEVRHLAALTRNRDTFVIKPANGFGGEGVVIVVKNHGGSFETPDGSRLETRRLADHLQDIMSGLYSLNQEPDQVLCEEKLETVPDLSELTYKGIPDIRVVVFRGVPVMAMLRLSTRRSKGKANLHQGGIGAGVDLETGKTTHAIYSGDFIENHPDSGTPLVGAQVPMWDAVLDLAARCHKAAPLGYMGVDVVLDPRHGPMVLELNVRPGLMIQMANRMGLKPILIPLEKENVERLDTAEKIALGRKLYRACRALA